MFKKLVDEWVNLALQHAKLKIEIAKEKEKSQEELSSLKLYNEMSEAYSRHSAIHKKMKLVQQGFAYLEAHRDCP